MTAKTKQDAKAKTNTEILSFAQNDDGLLGEKHKQLQLQIPAG